MTNVEVLRAFYARYITAKGACRDPRIQDAFTMVEREKYLGPGPWNVYTLTGYRRVSRYLSPQSCSQRLFKCGVRGYRDD